MATFGVTVLHEASAFAGLRDEWNALVRDAGKSPFSTHEWLSTYWTHYGGSTRLCVLLVRAEGGRLVGACPLQIRVMGAVGLAFVSRATLLGAPLTDMQDILARPGYEAEVVDLITAAIAEQGIDYLDLPELPDESPLRTYRASLRTLRGLSEGPTGKLPFVALPKGWSEFLATRGTSTQRNVKYYGNRLSKKHSLEFLPLTDPDDIESEFPTFLDLYAKRFADYPLLTSKEYRAFRSEMARLFAKNGWLILFVLKLNGLTVAAELCLRGGTTLYAYNSCYDVEWSREGTTLIMQARVLEHAIFQGISEYNFLRGEEAYKAHWATGARTQYALHLHRPSWRVQIVERSRGVRHLLTGAVATRQRGAS
ncbi:MAG: GNAT family N-acetyltransferase [Nitrospiraceae bacterium]